jgi:hypothetical protein
LSVTVPLTFAAYAKAETEKSTAISARVLIDLILDPGYLKANSY